MRVQRAIDKLQAGDFRVARLRREQRYDRLAVGALVVMHERYEKVYARHRRLSVGPRRKILGFSLCYRVSSSAVVHPHVHRVDAGYVVEMVLDVRLGAGQQSQQQRGKERAE